MLHNETHFKSVKSEVLRHLEDSETSKLAHWHAAAVYEKRHKIYIGLPATILSIFLTWLLSADFQALAQDSESVKSFVKSIPVFISLIVSVLSGLAAFLNYSELAIRHRTAAENLNVLWRDCRNWDTDFPDDANYQQAVQTVQSYRQRLNDVNRDAPQIPKWAWKSVRSQRREGSTTYAGENIKSG